MFCASCGKKISETVKFCAHCGANIHSKPNKGIAL